MANDAAEAQMTPLHAIQPCNTIRTTIGATIGVSKVEWGRVSLGTLAWCGMVDAQILHQFRVLSCVHV